ncbi:radical SAM protein [bacterium]|nr:radical SAM protein [bacterium]
MWPMFKNIHSGIKGRVLGFIGNGTQFLKRIIHRLGILLPPLRISIDITDACNFRCPTCDKWKSPMSPNEISLAEWELVFKKIEKLSLLREVAVSGGEPFIHPHIFDILKLAKQAGLRVVIISNGGALSQNNFQTLEEIGVDSLMLSLNSLEATIHDESRGTPGNHVHIMNLIRTWQQQSGQMGLSLSTIVMESNCHELSALATFAHENKLNGIMYQALLPTETHYAFAGKRQAIQPLEHWYTKNPYWVKRQHTLSSEIQKVLMLQRRGVPILNPPSQLRDFIKYFNAPGQLNSKPCLGTQNRLFIDPLGDIRLCYGFPPIGNILKDNPKLLWRSPRAKGIRQKSRHCNRSCRLQNCNI